ncbi:MAG: hypothetical protein ACQES2_08915 [Pseudomonadota bacterium]
MLKKIIWITFLLFAFATAQAAEYSADMNGQELEEALASEEDMIEGVKKAMEAGLLAGTVLSAYRDVLARGDTSQQTPNIQQVADAIKDIAPEQAAIVDNFVANYSPPVVVPDVPPVYEPEPEPVPEPPAPPITGGGSTSPEAVSGDR